MNCDDYLSMLAKQDVGELENGPAREHAITCDACDRVTRVVAERERNLLVAYGDLHMSGLPMHTAAEALKISRRRKVALYYRVGLGIAAAATLAYTIVAARVPDRPREATSRETFRLQCLSPEQAAELLRPYVRRTGSISIRAGSALGLIHVEASPHEMATAHKVLDRFDNPDASQCAVRVRIPKGP